jgi:hypothetical protein
MATASRMSGMVVRGEMGMATSTDVGGVNNRGHAVGAPRLDLLDAVRGVDAQRLACSRGDGLGRALGNRQADDAIVVADAAGRVSFARLEGVHGGL